MDDWSHWRTAFCLQLSLRNPLAYIKLKKASNSDSVIMLSVISVIMFIYKYVSFCKFLHGNSLLILLILMPVYSKMSIIILFVNNCLQISNATSLLHAYFCGSGFSAMTFAAFTRPAELAVAIHWYITLSISMFSTLFAIDGL